MVASFLSRFAVALAVAMAICAATGGGVRAQSNGVSLTLDSNTGSPLTGADAGSSFHMNFLLDDARRMSATEIGTTRDLEISLTAPNNSVFRFMFSPRPQFGIGYDPVSGTNRAYAGLTWNLFSANSLYGHFGVAGSFDPGIGGIDLRRGDEAPLMFHGALEFGYRLDQQNNLLFAVDQSVAPGAHGPGSEPADNFMFRFGRKF
jgi:hypothetical protein